MEKKLIGFQKFKSKSFNYSSIKIKKIIYKNKYFLLNIFNNKMEKITKIVCIICLISILILFWSLSRNNLVENFTDSEKEYRLADMIKSKKFRTNELKKKYPIIFPNSIATEYMKRTDENNDLDLVIDIIDKRNNDIHKKYNNYIIIHLRTGDVIDNTKYSVDNFLNENLKYVNNNQYVYPLSYYKKILEKLKKINSKNILLISGFHHKENHSKSIEYIDRIKGFFEDNNYKVEKRINNDPDDDFIIMCNSKYFVKSGGGFSRLISNIVEKKGGNVIKL